MWAAKDLFDAGSYIDLLVRGDRLGVAFTPVARHGAGTVGRGFYTLCSKIATRSASRAGSCTFRCAPTAMDRAPRQGGRDPSVHLPEHHQQLGTTERLVLAPGVEGHDLPFTGPKKVRGQRFPYTASGGRREEMAAMTSRAAATASSASCIVRSSGSPG